MIRILLLGLALVSGACSSSRIGVVYDEAGNPSPGIGVRLIAVDDEGHELSELGTTITNAAGEFNFDIEADPNASILVSALQPEGELRAFFAGSGEGIPVHPLTEAEVSLVFAITESADGRSVTDFAADELRQITDTLFAADSSALDLTDSTAVTEFVRTVAGRAIAEASGGSIVGQTTAELEGTPTTATATFEVNGSVCSYGISIYLLTSSNFRFDVEEDGSLCGDSSSQFSPILDESAEELSLPGNEFVGAGAEYPTPGDLTATIEDDRELDLGLQPLKVLGSDPVEADTLAVQRKIYVPATGDFARYLETIWNDGEADRTVTVKLRTLLTTGNSSALLVNDRFPLAPDEADRYFAVYDTVQSRPTAGFVIQDGRGSQTVSTLNAPGVASGKANEVTFEWSDVTVPAKGSRSILHYVYYTTSRSADEVGAALLRLTRFPDMTGMNRVELRGLANFRPSRGTVQGEAGAVIGRAEVTGTNSRTSESITVTARTDGSFALALDTKSGDQVSVTATDGLSLSLTIP